MSLIRINMVVSEDEHAQLHALLTTIKPKARASVLRQFAEFGTWIKENAGAVVPKPQVTTTLPRCITHPCSTGIRINMIVNSDEHAQLHSLLMLTKPKARSSVLRQFAEFGLWVKGNGGTVLASSNFPLESIPSITGSQVTVPVLSPAVHCTEDSILDSSVLDSINFGDF